MNHNTITGRDLLARGWETGPAIGAALRAAKTLFEQGWDQARVLARLDQVQADPDAVGAEDLFSATAQLLIRQRKPQVLPLRDEPAPLAIWGREMIDEGALDQIQAAARLPVTLKVALMPDAHLGYGLPIGGVAALQGAIAPNMVGVDIGCRMHATIFRRSPIHLKQAPSLYRDALLNHTFFGRNAPNPDQRLPHPILDDPRWQELPRHLRGLRDLAARQLGTSGSGNHFADFAALTVTAKNPLGIAPGEYIALVSHSGSRGVGYKAAKHYIAVAEQVCAFLPDRLRKLAYLDWRSGDAQEYEVAMSLAGDFAQANHEIIHQRVIEALGGEVAGTVQNHHNFAWRVGQADGPPVFIHRKGATPAERGVPGVIPGTMATPGFFVVGACNEADDALAHPALNSASHGSGRLLGRNQAQRQLDPDAVRRFLEQQGVTLLGGGLDEAPQAYKDSRLVMQAQSELVRAWAEFRPVIVRMDD
jgi:tRNA-splicing ligase RtcB